MVDHDVELIHMGVPVLEALVRGDLAGASALAGVHLNGYLLRDDWLWRIRLEQVSSAPGALDWIARAAVDASSGVVVGHAGFHGPPDARGMVEVAYSVAPEWRRQGYATAMLAAALAWAGSEPQVKVVRASISPENEPSLATVRRFGFQHVGEQWDEEDGLELLFELPLEKAR